VSYFNDLIKTIEPVYWDIHHLVQELYPLLTDPNNYGTMNQEEMYLLIGSGSAIGLSLLMIPLAVRQPAKKYVRRRSCLKEF